MTRRLLIGVAALLAAQAPAQAARYLQITFTAGGNEYQSLFGVPDYSHYSIKGVITVDTDTFPQSGDFIDVFPSDFGYLFYSPTDFNFSTMTVGVPFTAFASFDAVDFGSGRTNRNYSHVGHFWTVYPADPRYDDLIVLSADLTYLNVRTFESDQTLPTGVSFAIGSTGIPEPSTWALLVGGFGAIGGAMRSRRRLSVSFG